MREHAYASLQINSFVPKKRVDFVSKIKFEGEGGRFASQHVRHFLCNCNFYKVSNDLVKCIFFSLTLKGWIKQWFEAFPNNSIHTWEIIHELLDAFENCDYNELCAEVKSLWRTQGELVEDFALIFYHTCHRFTGS